MAYLANAVESCEAGLEVGATVAAPSTAGYPTRVVGSFQVRAVGILMSVDASVG